MRPILKLCVALGLCAATAVCNAQQSFALGVGASATAPPQALLNELSALVDKAETERSADRRFIEDLRAFIGQYDRPWSRVVLHDSFSDGDYIHTPQWRVIQGQFQVDRTYGLYSRATTASSQATGEQSNSVKIDGRDLAAALIGSILQQGFNKNSGGSTPAQPAQVATTFPTITTSIRANNAFAMEVQLVGISEGATVTLGLAANSGSDVGYQLNISAGNGASAELVRISNRGSAVVDRRTTTVTSGANVRHNISWTRYRGGQMRVTIDGRKLLDANDRGISAGFSTFKLSHTGELGFKSIKLSSTP